MRHPVSRALTGLGVVACVIGVGTIAYAHLSVGPELQRSVDVARRLADDAAGAVDALREVSRGADAARPPSLGVVGDATATLGPGIALFAAMRTPLGAIPGDAAGRLQAAVDDLLADARRLQRSSTALETSLRRHPVPSLTPTVDAAGARVGEVRTLLAENDPARGMTLLADLLAGLYLVMGAALIVVGRIVER